MDPNNNINQQPQQQPIQAQPQQPQAPAVQAPISPPNPQVSTPAPFVDSPKGGRKLTLVLIIFLIFLVGALAYFYFVNNQNSSDITPATQVPTIAPSPTATPTPAPEDLTTLYDAESPETDLQEIETDIKAL